MLSLFCALLLVYARSCLMFFDIDVCVFADTYAQDPRAGPPPFGGVASYQRPLDIPLLDSRWSSYQYTVWPTGYLKGPLSTLCSHFNQHSTFTCLTGQIAFVFVPSQVSKPKTSDCFLQSSPVTCRFSFCSEKCQWSTVRQRRAWQADTHVRSHADFIFQLAWIVRSRAWAVPDAHVSCFFFLYVFQRGIPSLPVL